jgi:D-glycero-D-manno-heptose 1,7-bisphosphate phosphatase
MLLNEVTKAGGRIDKIYVCPHTPENRCSCRKPEPGLILQAAEENSIDLGQSLLIGDALTDLAAGQAAGIKKNILVLTGRGSEQLALIDGQTIKPFKVYQNLFEALQIELTSCK